MAEQDRSLVNALLTSIDEAEEAKPTKKSRKKKVTQEQETITLAIKIPKSLNKQLKQIALDDDVTLKDVVIESLRNTVARKKS